jgi:radical SAM-linked protein
LVSEDKSKNNKFVKVIPRSREEEQSSTKTVPQINLLPSKYPSKKHNLPVKSAQKLEIVHTKTSNLRFISHLDVQRLFERALRRAEIPFSYTEGFNPRPKMQWLMPLPLYYESNYELMHLELSEVIEELELLNRLNKQLPAEFRIKSAKTLNLNDKLPNVENIKILYRILTCDPLLWEKYICETKTVIESFLSQKSLILKVLKKRQDQNSHSEKQLDIRPLVERLEVLNSTPLEIELVLSGNTRAEIVLDQIMLEVLRVGIQKDNFNEWQTNWKITREMIISRE